MIDYENSGLADKLDSYFNGINTQIKKYFKNPIVDKASLDLKNYLDTFEEEYTARLDPYKHVIKLKAVYKHTGVKLAIDLQCFGPDAKVEFTNNLGYKKEFNLNDISSRKYLMGCLYELLAQEIRLWLDNHYVALD